MYSKNFLLNLDRDQGAHIYHIGSKISDGDMWNPDVKKRLKPFNDKIAEKLANNRIIEDSEDSPEEWHLDDASKIDDTYLPY